MLAPNFFVRLTRSVDSYSKNERLSEGISGNIEKSSVVVELDLVSDVDDELFMRFLLMGVFGELLPIDKGGEHGEDAVEEEPLFLEEITTSDRDEVNFGSPKRNLLGGISTELLRERDGVGGSVEGLRVRLLLEISIGFLERGCVCI
jgi:hypothetical protein